MIWEAEDATSYGRGDEGGADRERLVGAQLTADDLEADHSLRPKMLDDYLGQTRVKENLRVLIEAAKKRADPLDHELLRGISAQGKARRSVRPFADRTAEQALPEKCVSDLTIISGQKPIITKAKKSIANFKIREGMAIGCKVTLRGVRMYDFADRLISLALPRVRDFRGVSADSFDGRGNYALGIKEQLIFPEISYDKIDKVRGMDIIFVTTAKTDEEAKELLALMGMPFVK